jgi:hypothetical protein
MEDSTRWQGGGDDYLFLTSEVWADGIYLFDSGKEVGLIKRENGQWIIYLFDRPSPITLGSLQAAQYHALACYIETVWLNEGATTVQ